VLDKFSEDQLYLQLTCLNIRMLNFEMNLLEFRSTIYRKAAKTEKIHLKAHIWYTKYIDFIVPGV